MNKKELDAMENLAGNWRVKKSAYLILSEKSLCPNQQMLYNTIANHIAILIDEFDQTLEEVVYSKEKSNG